MNALAIQIAFTLPLTLPVVIGIAALRPAWFYPAFMITLGAHYLPFVFLYGMAMTFKRFGISHGAIDDGIELINHLVDAPE